MRFFLSLIFAIFVGLSLGLIGGGGSILAVPILRYVVGVGAKEAIAMSLFIVGIVSVIGLIPHWQKGHVNLPVALSFIPPAMIGAFFGAKITRLPFINDTIQLVSFGLIMLLASIFMIIKNDNSSLEIKGQPVEKEDLIKKIFFTLIQGFSVGILTGFVVVGGGFLIIPALVLVGRIPMKEAVGTSLLIIATNSASAFLGYWNQVVLDWGVMITFAIASSLGIILGANIGQKLDTKLLQKAFGYFVLAVAIFVLIVR